ncbi:MAG: hypothetical protein OSA84_03975 [Akkermansiaceae bacterium]|nr:hypothetical protein [Akkermansiaceae bacterium]
MFAKLSVDRPSESMPPERHLSERLHYPCHFHNPHPTPSESPFQLSSSPKSTAGTAESHFSNGMNNLLEGT